MKKHLKEQACILVFGILFKGDVKMSRKNCFCLRKFSAQSTTNCIGCEKVYQYYSKGHIVQSKQEDGRVTQLDRKKANQY